MQAIAQSNNVSSEPKNQGLTSEDIQKILMSEQAIIGSILSASKSKKIDLLNTIFKQVKGSDFRLDEHRVIFDVTNRIYQQRNMPDATLVFQSLKSSGFTDPKYGEYVFRLDAQSQSQIDENFSAHLEIVRNYGTLKELAKLGKSIEVLALGSNSSEEVYQKSLELLKEVPRNIENSNFLCDVEELNEFLSLLETRFNGEKTSHWATGFEDLDDVMHIEKGNVMVLAGRPSMGKTTFALNIVTAYLRRKMPTLFISMEMSKTEIYESIIASVGKVNIGNLKKGTIKPNEWAGINAGLAFLQDAPLVLNEQTRFTRSTLRSTIEDAVATYNVEAVVIDYLQLIGFENPNGMPVNEIGAISREIKLIAKELGIAIILLSQLSREVEKRPNKRPIMSDLRESGAIEQDADKIVFIYRDEIYNPDSDEKGTAEIIGAKNRGGTPFNVRMITELEFGRFRDFVVSDYHEMY
jgi:replicative DNA helicase